MSLLKYRERAEDVIDVRAPLGPATISGVIVHLFQGQGFTLEYNERLLRRNAGDVIRVYRELSKDLDGTRNFERMLQVVLGQVLIEWYTIKGVMVPVSVERNQQQRLREARMSEQSNEQGGTATAPAKRTTIKSIIENGLLAGDSNEKILAAVKAHNPEAKADDNHIKYYRYYMVKDGRLQADESTTKRRAKKASPDGAPVVNDAPGEQPPAEVAQVASAEESVAAPPQTEEALTEAEPVASATPEDRKDKRNKKARA